MNSVRSPAPGAALFNLPVNKKNNAIVNAVNTAVNSASNAVNTAVNSASNVMNSGTNLKSKLGGNIVQIILIGLLVVVVVLFALFWKQINGFLSMSYEQLRQLFGAKQVPITPRQDDSKTVNKKPKNPQDLSSTENNLVEKVLPGQKEVFNVSKNAYTYYDAEPLCKALNAELATYEQVKKAYSQGADWCNYGWVKGQMAVYPTQKSTFDTLQTGPEKDRLSCGRPGLNGGYFDNPELKYGVNCYGTKPNQKAHDATAVTSGDGAPLSPGGLEQEKKVAKYRGEMNYISVLPWNKNAWSS